MKTLLILLLTMIVLGGCSTKETIAFTALPKAGFNATPFQLPAGIPDSLKQAHDSCMGFAFDVNALFIQTRDTFPIGSIVNRQSLKLINTIRNLGVSQSQLASQFTVLTNPCYEKEHCTSSENLTGADFSLSLPGATDALNKELKDVVAASDNAEMNTGSWVYLDVQAALMTILDTTQKQDRLLYKQNLLDTANMVLTAVESVTDVSFIITTPQSMSEPLLALLKTKPSVMTPASRASLSLYYISDNKFEMTLNGFFPVLGQFMKAELK